MQSETEEYSYWAPKIDSWIFSFKKCSKTNLYSKNTTCRNQRLTVKIAQRNALNKGVVEKISMAKYG